MNFTKTITNDLSSVSCWVSQMARSSIKIVHGALFLSVALLTACSGVGGGAAAPAVTPAPAPTYTIGGVLTGLTGTGLILQDNAGDNLAVSAVGNFTFVTPVTSGGAYAVTVKTQPSNPVQTCTVNSGSGTATANVTGVAVICSTNAYPVGGTVSGLTGTGLVLQNNAGDNLMVSANGAFSFATSVASGAGYAVSVKTQPSVPAQNCIVGSGSGTVSATSINSVSATCSMYAPRFAYVANSVDNTVSIYTVNAATGQLRANGYVAAGTGPQSVTVDPSGKFVFVANSGSANVSVYTINASNGGLTGVGAVAAGTNPYSVTVDPTGKFAYVANFGSNNVSAYTINATTGVLTSVGAAVAAGNNPKSVTTTGTIQ